MSEKEDLPLGHRHIPGGGYLKGACMFPLEGTATGKRCAQPESAHLPVLMLSEPLAESLKAAREPNDAECTLAEKFVYQPHGSHDVHVLRDRCWVCFPEDRAIEVRAVAKEIASFLDSRERALKERVSQLEASMVSHFQREHLEGDGPEIDRWRLQTAALREEIEDLHAQCKKISSERDDVYSACADTGWWIPSGNPEIHIRGLGTRLANAEERAERLEERLRIAAQDRADARMRVERLEKRLEKVREAALAMVTALEAIPGLNPVLYAKLRTFRASLSEQE